MSYITPSELKSDAELEELATWRYHNDPFFHAVVYSAVQMAVPKTINEVINKAMRDAGTMSASIALILQEIKEDH